MGHENWYYARNSIRQGPVALEALRELIRQGIVGWQDLVWTDGMADWQPVSSVVELMSAPPERVVAVPAMLNYLTPLPLDVDHVYAGFWLRFAACFIDWFILFLPSCFLGPLLIPASLVIPWIYAALMESSSHQATLGKLALGLRVTDMNGQRISFARATARHFAKFISTWILFIGYMMAGWTERKQALHDKITECLVIRTR
jgi:hypothetical protein